MAPPTPIFTKTQLPHNHRFAIDPRTGEPNCPLKQLTQYQCELEGNGSNIVTCFPFTRVFRACADRKSNNPVLIEVTNEDTQIKLL